MERDTSGVGSILREDSNAYAAVPVGMRGRLEADGSGSNGGLFQKLKVAPADHMRGNWSTRVKVRRSK